MSDFVIDLIARAGYPGIFLLMALENIFPPIPSELIMGLGGVLVAEGRMQFWPLLLVGTAGTLAGNWFWFGLGWKFGYRRLRPLVLRWGRWFTIEWRDVIRAQRCFSRNGHWMVLVLRMSPLFRTLISLPAGIARMNFWRFSLVTYGGSLAWNAVLVKGGALAGRWLAQSGALIGWLVAGALVAMVAVYIWRVFTWAPRTRGRAGPPRGE